MKNIGSLFCTALSLTIALGMTAHPGFAQSQELDLPADVQTTTPLKPGDQLRLTVAGFPDLSGEQIILSDGTIQLPLVGLLKVSRLTPVQAAALTTEALRPYVRRPQVALSLLSVSPLRVSITGEVLQPGPRLLNPFVQQNQINRTGGGSQTNSPVTASDALILAGGITPTADLRNITIRRLVPSNRIAANFAPSSLSSSPFPPASPSLPSLPSASPTMVRTEVKVDLWKAIQSGDLTADARIYDGDEIVVPPAQLSNPEQQALLTSTIAPTKITVQVTGEVTRPGQIEISPNARVTETIAAAGGPTDKADKRSIELFRLSPNGQLERQTFDFNKPSVSLRNGDLIVVKKSGSSKFFDALGRALIPFYPITTILNLFR